LESIPLLVKDQFSGLASHPFKAGADGICHILCFRRGWKPYSVFIPGIREHKSYTVKLLAASGSYIQETVNLIDETTYVMGTGMLC